MRSESRQSAGFTLLEVMVSLAIVGGLLVTVIYSLNYHLGVAERHEFVTIASMLAREKLRENEKQPSTLKGNFPDPYAAYSFSTEVKSSEYPGISLLTVVVRRGNEDVRFTQMIRKPKS